MRFPFVLSFVPLIGAIGCAGNGSSVDGSIAGKHFASAHAVSSSTSAQGPLRAAIISIADTSDVCARITAGDSSTSFFNVQALTLELMEGDGQGDSVAATHTGDYAITSFAVIDDSVPAGQLAVARYQSIGATTNDLTTFDATAGSVTLDSAEPGHYVGTFDLTLSNDRVTGRFDTTVCAALNL